MGKQKILDAFLRIGIVFAGVGLVGITVGNPVRLEGLHRKRKILDAFLRIGIVFAGVSLVGITVGNPLRLEGF